MTTTTEKTTVTLFAPVDPAAKAARIHATMSETCRREADRFTGYQWRPIEVLRQDPSVLTLLDMMETCRPGGSDSEEAFIGNYLAPLGAREDAYGNLHVEVPIPEGHPRILWSCHTDTVHRHSGKQVVEVSHGMAWTSTGSCLGSDDAVGIWLAMEMIKAGVPGVYVFHRDEESGGKGSSWLARQAPDYISSFAAAIAMDRAGYADVITHQGGQRCCSDLFATSLATLLGGTFKPCDGGVFTDTANYVDLIGECTNLSVGYFSQHGPAEHTNLSFAVSLRDTMVAADWSKLEFKREPGEVDEMWSRGRYFGGRWDEDEAYTSRTTKKAPAYAEIEGEEEAMDRLDELDAMEDYARDFPWVVAEYLLEMGVTMADLDNFEPKGAGR